MKVQENTTTNCSRTSAPQAQTYTVSHFLSFNRRIEKLQHCCNIKLEAALFGGLSGLQQSLPELSGELNTGAAVIAGFMQARLLTFLYACAAWAG